MNRGLTQFLKSRMRSADDGAGGGGADPSNVGGGSNEITIDLVQKFLSENDQGKNWFQKEKDTYLTNGINSWKDGNLNNLVEDEINKRFPPETEDQKKLRELEDKFAKAEREKVKESLVNKALKIASEKKLPVELIDYFVGDTEEVTAANLGKLEDIFKSAVNAAVEERFKAAGRDPGTGQGSNIKTEGIAKALLKNTSQNTNLEEARKNYF